MNLHLAGCVILDKDQKIYLLHRNKKGLTQWELPGGKIEPNESAERAAIRELREELGVIVSLVKSLGTTHFEENNIEHVYNWFLAEIQEGELSILEPETFDEFKSFSLNELPNLKLSNNMIKLQEAVMAGSLKLV
jgi:8-oxo-dGTP diphosphatase